MNGAFSSGALGQLSNPMLPQRQSRVLHVCCVCRLSVPGVSSGENGCAAQEFFIQISTRHREGCVLSHEHSADGEQSLEHIKHLTSGTKPASKPEPAGQTDEGVHGQCNPVDMESGVSTILYIYIDLI